MTRTRASCSRRDSGFRSTYRSTASTWQPYSVCRIEHEHRIQTRWGDFDALGHLNHVSYLVYCDEARDAALAALGGGYVVARQEIDYRREIPLGTREVVVRTRIASVGASSIHVEHEIADGAATAAAVVVAWDRESRAKRELTQAERDALRT